MRSVSLNRLSGSPRPATSKRKVSKAPCASKDNSTPMTMRREGHCQGAAAV
jgi:hypothetical protein